MKKISKSVTTGLKCSETLKIKAAVVEIMENAGFAVIDGGDLKPAEKEGFFLMSFQRGITSLDELVGISGMLGDNFNISIFPNDKLSINVSVEASLDSFKELLPPSREHDSKTDGSLFKED